MHVLLTLAAGCAPSDPRARERKAERRRIHEKGADRVAVVARFFDALFVWSDRKANDQDREHDAEGGKASYRQGLAVSVAWVDGSADDSAGDRGNKHRSSNDPSNLHVRSIDRRRRLLELAGGVLLLSAEDDRQ
jgi:hypothetical protein